jgi:Tfp pilus assembly protein PilF
MHSSLTVISEVYGSKTLPVPAWCETSWKRPKSRIRLTCHPSFRIYWVAPPPSGNRHYPIKPDTSGHTVGSNPSTNRQRLDSWKEIAVFFGRDERTVNRWEKELGLPVHRLPGTKGRVYAYTDELSDWLAGPRNERAAMPEQQSPSSPDSQTAGARLTVVAGRHPIPDAASAPPVSLEAVPTRSVAARHGNPGWIVAAALIGLTALALMLIRHPIAGLDFAGAKRGAGNLPQASSSRVVQASSHAHNPEAEQLYLKGRYYWNKRTPDDLTKAVDYFVQAIVHDPNYASAYVGLADCYNLLREYALMPASEAYARAFAAAKKAVELDDQSSAAHASLAFALFYGKWDVADAELEFRRAIDLDPNNAVAHHWYATYLLTLRRLPESLTEIERAQALDPASTSILADKGDILFQAGQRDEAIALLKQMEATEPAFRSPHRYLKDFYLTELDYPNFLAESRKDALLLHDNTALVITTAGEKGFAAGGAKAMLESMLQVEKRYYAQRLVSPFVVAQTCALLGNKVEALQYLKAAYDQHDELLLWIENYPALNSLHDEPAYRDLLERMNLPVEN